MAKAKQIPKVVYKSVGIDDVLPYDKNPRKGNMKIILESLQAHGQYRPITVQKSTNKIMAGNHTWKAAKQLGWTHIDVGYVDCNDEQAKAIVLVDNRSNDAASYDNEVLSALLESMDEPALGTGYDKETVNLILDASSNGSVIDLAGIMSNSFDEDEAFDNAPFGEEDGDVGSEEDNSVGGGDIGSGEQSGPVKAGEFESSEDDLPGVIQLKEDYHFPGRGAWEIPALRSDRLLLAADVPKDIRMWIGKAPRSYDEGENVDDVYWLFNFGLHSSTGMPDLSKMIVGFFVGDDHFEPWWANPARYVTKMLVTGVKYAIMPDWSQLVFVPRINSAWNVYRNFWMSRYMQEAGLTVIPQLNFRRRDDWYITNFVLPLLQEWEVVVLSVQNRPDDNTPEQEKEERDHARLLVTTTKAKHVIIYGSESDYKWFLNLGLSVTSQWIKSNTLVMRERMPKKTKETL